MQRIICDLSIGMHSQGLSVQVVSMVGGGLEGELKDRSIDVVILSSRKKKYHSKYFRSLVAALKLAWALRGKKIQAVNIHGFGMERIVLLAAKLAGTKIKTFVFHSNYPDLQANQVSSKLLTRLKRSISSIDHFIAISPSVRELVIASRLVLPQDISVITNGVDIARVRSRAKREFVRKSLGFSRGDILLIQVGRFHPLKNHDISVKAMSIILNRYPEAHLLLVGDGPRLQSIKALAQERRVHRNVHFLGQRSDVTELLGASDLFLLPSSWEGLPISLLEAFANSLPAIVADVPGIRDVVSTQQRIAKLVNARDERSLATAILEALEDSEWISQAKSASFNLVKSKFKSTRMVADYISLHEHILSRI